MRISKGAQIGESQCEFKGVSWLSDKEHLDTQTCLAN